VLVQSVDDRLVDAAAFGIRGRAHRNGHTAGICDNSVAGCLGVSGRGETDKGECNDEGADRDVFHGCEAPVFSAWIKKILLDFLLKKA
jgi:hypothetical protein